MYVQANWQGMTQKITGLRIPLENRAHPKISTYMEIAIYTDIRALCSWPARDINEERIDTVKIRYASKIQRYAIPYKI